MFLAEKPKRAFASLCKLVRSNKAGAIEVVGLASSVTLPDFSLQAATIESAAALLQRRSAFFSGSVSSFLNFVSNQRPSYTPCAHTNSARTSQKSRETKRLIFSSRSTTIESVGVCTRPTVVR